MVNSIGLSNVSFGAVPQATANARQYMQAPSNFTGAPETDTVEITGKKKSSAVKKGIIGTIAGVAIAAAALYAGVKTGKLTKVENASKWTEKLQNLAFEGGSYVKKGVDYVTAKGKDLYEKFAKKGNGEIKPFPEKDANGQLYFQFAPNEAPKA